MPLAIKPFLWGPMAPKYCYYFWEEKNYKQFVCSTVGTRRIMIILFIYSNDNMYSLVTSLTRHWTDYMYRTNPERHEAMNMHFHQFKGNVCVKCCFHFIQCDYSRNWKCFNNNNIGTCWALHNEMQYRVVPESLQMFRIPKY